MDFSELVEFEKLSDEERLNFFKQAFSLCIRCYACRQVCPMCYCDECLTEKSLPQWIETTIKPSSNLFFHIMRAYHLTGRCVECGECRRVCPMHLPLDLLYKKASQMTSELFGQQPGIDPEQKSPLFHFDLNDSDITLLKFHE
jgi:L-lactate utilization protein LutB